MIEIRNLTKKYTDYAALNDISFNIRKGEVLGFLGPNGAGKTTTMKLLTSFLDASEGDITIAGLDVRDNSLEIRKKIGYLPEMVPLYEEFLVYEYLNFVAEIRGVPKQIIHSRTKEVMSECGLRDVATKTIDNLSKGYKQRVGLAQAIIHEPDILILDEPTTGLDPNQIIEIRKLIRKIGREKTIIFSTHILSEASSICDRIVIINKGEIVAIGTPQELSESAKKGQTYSVVVRGKRDMIYNYLKTISGINRVDITKKESENTYIFELTPNTNVDLREVISQSITKKGDTILGFTRESASLEDIFGELTK